MWQYILSVEPEYRFGKPGHCHVFCRIAADYDRIADESLVEPEGYLANPVNAYMLCKRFTTELTELKQFLHSPAIIRGKCCSSAPTVNTLLLLSNYPSLWRAHPLAKQHFSAIVFEVKSKFSFSITIR